MSARRPQPHRFRSDQRGAAAVEFGMMLPLLMLLVGGIVDMGTVLYEHHVITKSVRAGTRYLSRVADPTAAAFVAEAEQMVTTGYGGVPLLPADGTIAVAFDVQVIDNTAGAFAGPAQIRVITGEVTYPATFPFLAMFGVTDMTMGARHSERHIGE